LFTYQFPPLHFLLFISPRFASWNFISIIVSFRFGIIYQHAANLLIAAISYAYNENAACIRAKKIHKKNKKIFTN